MNASLASASSPLPNAAFESVTQSLANRASPLDGPIAPSGAQKAAESFEAFLSRRYCPTCSPASKPTLSSVEVPAKPYFGH